MPTSTEHRKRSKADEVLTAIFTDQETADRVASYQELVRQQHIERVQAGEVDPGGSRAPRPYAKQRVAANLIIEGRDYAQENRIVVASSVPPETRERTYKVSMMIKMPKRAWQNIRAEAVLAEVPVEELANLYLRFGLEIAATRLITHGGTPPVTR